MFKKVALICALLLTPLSTVAEENQEIRIAVMGDSLSAAYYIPLESGWVNLMRQRLTSLHPSVRVINSSISGATTAAGLQTLPAVLKKERPHIVILELGGNDGLQGKPVSLITRNLETMIRQSSAAGAKVLLAEMRLPPNMGARYTGPFYRQYADLAEKYQLGLIPFMLEGVVGDSKLMQDDGIHPTAAAQPKILENVWPLVLQAIQELDRTTNESQASLQST